MQLYLMRHGQTNYNLLELCNDDPHADVHLTETGKQQAQRAAATLGDIPLDRILISELPRTRQTADIINQYHQAPIEVVPALNDIRSGYEGRPVADYFAAIGTDRFNVRPECGESVRDYQARVLPALDWLCRQPWSNVLIVAHEETLRVLVAALRGLSSEELLALHFGNCETLHFKLDKP
jgi:broad specificity phosphatase PhoE